MSGRRRILAVLATLGALAGAGAGASSAAASPLECGTTTGPCIRYCAANADGAKYPCGFGGGVPNLLSGGYSYSVPLSAAAQDATRTPGDPGGSGTSNISMNVAANTVCATTTWSGIDTKVVWGHIHGGAYGMPENPAISIELFPADFLNGRPSGISGCTLVAPGEIWAIAQCPAQFNVVVHSQGHAAGAIRGQLGSRCAI
jgi:hypothetical protein